jgi:hypothetical protein
MTQLNTPYPSTAYLTGFPALARRAAVQEDLALALVLALFSRAGLQRLCGEVERPACSPHRCATAFAQRLRALCRHHRPRDRLFAGP